MKGGNPTSSTEANPTVIYETPGTYDVQLIVQNDAGADTSSLEAYVVVADRPIADFSYAIDGNTVRFQNLSVNASSYQWNFGDNSPIVNEENPTHTFIAGDLYKVSLESRNQFCSSAISKTIEILIPTSTHYLSQSIGLRLSPNPTHDIIHLSWHNNKLTKIDLLHINGQLAARQHAVGKNKTQFDLKDLPKGVYLLMLKTEKHNWLEKIVKL